MRLSVLLQFPCLVKRVGAKACERAKQRDHAAATVPSMTADQGQRARNGITCPDVTHQATRWLNWLANLNWLTFQKPPNYGAWKAAVVDRARFELAYACAGRFTVCCL